MIDDEQEHFFGKIAQKALIIKGESVLVVRHSGNIDTWELPGGRLNRGEDPKAGVAREIKEELGITIQVGDAVSFEQFVMKRTEELHFAIVYKACLVGDEPFDLAPDEVAEVAWVNRETWRNYQYFGNYERVLALHFNSSN